MVGSSLPGTLQKVHAGRAYKRGAQTKEPNMIQVLQKKPDEDPSEF